MMQPRTKRIILFVVIVFATPIVIVSIESTMQKSPSWSPVATPPPAPVPRPLSAEKNIAILSSLDPDTLPRFTLEAAKKVATAVKLRDLSPTPLCPEIGELHRRRNGLKDEFDRRSWKEEKARLDEQCREKLRNEVSSWEGLMVLELELSPRDYDFNSQSFPLQSHRHDGGLSAWLIDSIVAVDSSRFDFPEWALALHGVSSGDLSPAVRREVVGGSEIFGVSYSAETRYLKVSLRVPESQGKETKARIEQDKLPYILFVFQTGKLGPAPFYFGSPFPSDSELAEGKPPVLHGRAIGYRVMDGERTPLTPWLAFPD